MRQHTNLPARAEAARPAIAVSPRLQAERHKRGTPQRSSFASTKTAHRKNSVKDGSSFSDCQTAQPRANRAKPRFVADGIG